MLADALTCVACGKPLLEHFGGMPCESNASSDYLYVKGLPTQPESTDTQLLRQILQEIKELRAELQRELSRIRGDVR